VMMEAYFDESGIHSGAKVCVVAGYYGSQASWKRFEGQWKKVLAAYPEVAAKGFHAKVFFGRNEHGERVREYKGWSDDKAAKFLERLIQTIIRNRIYPIGYGVIVNDFDSLPLMTRLWLTGAQFNKNGEVLEGGCPSKSYYLPFQFCVLKAATKSNATVKDKLHFFAGLDRTLGEYADEFLRILRVDKRLPSDQRNRLGTIAYPLSKDTPGIQAADLLSNRIYKRAMWVLNHPNSNSDPTPLLATLLKNWQGGVPTLKLMNTDMFAAMALKGQEEFEKLKASGKAS
jgi:hypothetical protein